MSETNADSVNLKLIERCYGKGLTDCCNGADQLCNAAAARRLRSQNAVEFILWMLVPVGLVIMIFFGVAL